MNASPEIEDKETDRQQKRPRKKRRSKLDPFTAELLQMDQEKKTLPEMVAWLGKRDLTVAPASLSQFFQIRREEAELKAQQAQLQVRANKCAVFEEWFAKNPKPDLGTVIEMFKLLMMELAADKAVDPELLRLADKLARTALRHVNDERREAYRTRKLVMEEEKHREWVKCERARGFEFCLEEAKKYPAVVDLYQAAFEALKNARGRTGNYDER